MFWYYFFTSAYVRMTIRRTKSGRFLRNRQEVSDPETLLRLRRLGIPPNWSDVRISESPVAHLQATGRDAKGRIQYVYHPMWVLLAQDSKYQRMVRFQKRIGNLWDALRTDGTDELRLMFRILWKTHMRVGNESYAKDNGTYGLCTLEWPHVSVSGDSVTFEFVGKKGIPQRIRVRDRDLAKGLSALGGRTGRIFSKGPEDLNAFLQKHVGEEFTCKDFRTYASNILFLRNLSRRQPPDTVTERKRVLKEVYEDTAKKLGHTKEISKKSYVMPVVSERYLEDPHFFFRKDPARLLGLLVAP